MLKKKQLKLSLIHFDQPFHPVILYENYLIRIVMYINKTSKIVYWLSSKREGGSSILTWCAMLCSCARHIYSEKNTDNTQVAVAPSRHD